MVAYTSQRETADVQISYYIRFLLLCPFKNIMPPKFKETKFHPPLFFPSSGGVVGSILLLELLNMHTSFLIHNQSKQNLIHGKGEKK